MPASDSLPDSDRSPLSVGDRRALARFLEDSLDHGFRLAIVEAANHDDREAILADVAAQIGPNLLRVALEELPGAEANVWNALRAAFNAHTPRCLAVSGLENDPSWPRQLNVQRDLFVRDLPVPWLLFIHPATRVPLLQDAPDFCDFAILWLRDSRPLAALAMPSLPQLEAGLSLPGEFVLDHPLLQRAQAALDGCRFAEARDLLDQFDLQRHGSVLDNLLHQLLRAALEYELGHLGVAEAILRDAQSTLARHPSSPECQTLGFEIDANLSAILHRSGRHVESEALARRSLESIKATLGSKHERYAKSLRDLANVLLSRGRYQEAEGLLRESLAIHGTALDSIHDLTNLVLFQGKLPEAKQLAQESLAIIDATLGRSHAAYGAVLGQIANILTLEGNDAGAEASLREALSLHEKIFGREHPLYATTLHNLAMTLANQDNLVDAERLFREVLTIKEKAIGHEHPSYSASMHELASVLSRRGNDGAAERLLREAITIEENTLGLDHPTLGVGLASLAIVLAHQGRYPESLPLLERALQIRRAALGADHPDVKYIQSLLQRFRTSE